MLFCAGGLTRHRRVGGEDYHFRAAPSAGALYPVELYVAAGEVEGLAPGLYHFSPADLKLRALRPGDFRLNIARAANDRDSLAGARANLIASTIFWRSTWNITPAPIATAFGIRARCSRICSRLRTPKAIALKS